MARDAPSSAAAWSADATFPGGNGLIVFSRHKSPASYRNGDWPDLYTVNPRGSPARRIVRAAAQAAWSPDGRRLAVVDCCSDKPAKVLQGAPTVIEPSILSPAWAPDGSRLVGFGCVYGDCGVVIADLDGGATSLLFETGDYSGDMGAEEPEWAPRGALIALTTWGNLNPEDRRIELYDIQARRFRARPSIDGANASWSPDGTRLAFDTTNSYTSTPLPRSAVIVARADGSRRRLLTRGWDPAWSPDGRRIAFVRMTSATNADIFVMNADGTGQRRLTSGPAFDHEPDWQPVRR